MSKVMRILKSIVLFVVKSVLVIFFLTPFFSVQADVLEMHKQLEIFFKRDAVAGVQHRESV